ncbi:putative methyltransferase required for the conversion of demethylmenaquinol (DMKH2) to menaquinol (MKH2) [Lyophyllum shimeji]|uniref:Methyltransferase required for the conversion of demethylmenaquinol (DMKH2) to menaquinol (MKH2) n=1 Tax=Lyophyllum shimeji TaxID=47721 RepID=A0A9P3UR55_LYOSH|nr:putative methyltransferase required for the conversion of demethylmenaquinol (DMKH2) to menaquinol (MKH2) [Lyophyllum shimeji]
MTTKASATLAKFFADKNIAKTYSSAERATSPPARALLLQAGLHSPGDGSYEILDNACGTGVVTMALIQAFKGKEEQLKVVCGDFSPRMVEAVKERISQVDGLQAEARELNGQAMEIEQNRFTHVLTNFGFQSFPEPLSGLRESIRVAKPGGTVGMTNWITAGWVPAFRLAVSRIPGAPSPLQDPLPFMTRTNRFFDVAWTRQQLEAIPEVDPTTIQIEEHTFVTTLKSEAEISELVTPMEGMLSVFTSDWSEEEQKACGEGRLLESIKQAVREEPDLVWKSLITTVRKRA